MTKPNPQSVLALCACATISLFAPPVLAQTNCKPSAARYKANGALDLSFTGDGTTTVSFPESTFVRGEAAAAGLDGKVVVAGYAYTSSDGYVFMLTRFNSDGSLDSSFDGDGRVLTDFTSQRVEQAYAIVIYPNGKIVVGGTAEGKFALARYNDDGSLDRTFDGDGKVLTDFTSMADEYITSLAIAPEGKIIAAGAAQASSGGAQFALARYNVDGSLDTTFDGDGKVLTNFSSSSNEVIQDVAIAPDGKIVVAGYAELADSVMAVARYKTNGRLDRSFDGDGKVLVSGEAAAFAVLVDEFGRVVIGGHVKARFAVARLTTSGALDGFFGSGGISVVNFTSQSAEFIQDLAFTGSSIVGIGPASSSGNQVSFAGARFKTSGALDKTFDGDGKLLTSIPGQGWNWAYAGVFDSYRRLVVAGSSCQSP